MEKFFLYVIATAICILTLTTHKGSNFGNRRVRHAVRQLLRLEGKEKRD